MMAHNLCYSTWISPQYASKLKPEQYTKTPTGGTDVCVRVRALDLSLAQLNERC
jgi:hypothetical protein